MINIKHTSALVALSLMLACAITDLNAFPSGGPYGPVSQVYEVPQTDGTIYYVAPDGDANAAGKSLDKPTTLESAIKKVVTGDVIILRGGTYRTGNLTLNQGITMQPYKGEHPVLKGSFVAEAWTDLKNGLWVTSWEHLFPMKPDSWWRRQLRGVETPLHRFNNDMVFIDGVFLQSAGWQGEVDEFSYYIDYENKEVYIGKDPTDHLVEITAFDIAIHRITGECHGKKSDGKGFTLRGVTLTQYAYRAMEIDGKDPEGLSDESQHGKDVVGTTIENCEITYCSRVAAYLRGDKLTLRSCKISDTSTEGIYILSSSDVLVEKNIFRRNNIENITGYYPAAVKIFNQTYRVTCNDNLVIEQPNSNGIWYDVGNVDGVFTNNWIQGVGKVERAFKDNKYWPSSNGFFFEISKGAICAGNLFVNCDQGIFILNSSNVQVYENTFVNSTAIFGRDTRSAQGDHFGWHPSTGPDVDERFGHKFVNNTLIGGDAYNRPMVAIWQSASLCDKLKDPMMKKFDYNTYVRNTSPEDPLMFWSPFDNEKCLKQIYTLDEIRSVNKKFEANSIYLPNFYGSVFKSPELGNFELIKPIPGSKKAKLPEDIRKLIK